MASPHPSEAARRALQEAADFGVDLAMLDANLALTPAERLRRNGALLALAEQAQRQTLSKEQRDRLARHTLLEEIRAYGFDDVIARYEAMTSDAP